MRIDAHQHFWKYDPVEYAWLRPGMEALRRDFLPEEFEPQLRQTGFQGSILVQVRQSLEETRWMLEIADEHPFVKGVVGWVDLSSPEAAAQMDGFRGSPKLVGLRHIAESEPDDRFLLGEAFLRGIALLEERRLVYDILIYPRHLKAATELVTRFPGVRFVLDHAAKPEIRKGELRDWAADLRELASRPNIMCKLSGLVTEADWKTWTPEQLRPYLDVLWDAFGPERLLIGSDWPVCTVAADYARATGLVLDYLSGRPAAEQEAVCGGNAVRLWNLEERAR